MPEAKLEITGETGGDLRSYRVSFDKARTHLPGFAPEWTIDRGCEELKRWSSSRQHSIDDCQSRQYVRLKQLRHLMTERRLTETLYWANECAAQRSVCTAPARERIGGLPKPPAIVAANNG